MFDLSYRKIMNKRRYGRYGPKQRYAVFRAERNIYVEEEEEDWARKICEEKGLDLDNFKINSPRSPWVQTVENLRIYLGWYPYGQRYLKGLERRDPERHAILLENIEIRNTRL